MTKMTGCPRCSNGTLIELEMTAKNGQVLALASCTRCETRTWASDGSPISMDEVLRITSGDPDFAVVPSEKKVRRTRSAP
jgi:hypothetical protein